MKRFFQTIKNIFKIEELRKRLGYTFLLLLVYRLGSFVVVPGIDPTMLQNLEAQASTGLLSLLDMFSGGAFGNASIFALGSGRRKMNQWTRYLTIVILLLQGPAYITNLHAQLPPEAFLVQGFGFNIFATIVLMAGTMFVMWLGERITDRGIGNGISLIIMVGIIARLPFALFAEAAQRFSQTNGGPLMFLIEIVILFLVFIATIALVQGQRKVPVQYAKRVVGLKINAAGVMPIIFAQALMMFPLLLSRFDASQGLAATLSDYTGFWYNFIFAFLVIVFTYFYTAVTVNPNMMAEEMKKNGGFIPGVKPGKKTVDYLDAIMSRITLPGSFFLAIVAILPAFAMMFGINNQFSQFYGGTSLLILVGVVLDTLQQIESHLLMRHYDGLMKTGRLKGRSGM